MSVGLMNLFERYGIPTPHKRSALEGEPCEGHEAMI